jgi:hypothetical protein
MNEESYAIVCEDAGAANALAPVSMLLASEATVRCVLGPAAFRAQSRWGGEARVVETPAGFEDSLLWISDLAPRAILTGTTCWGLRIEALSIRWARQTRTRSLSYIDFWSNYQARLSFPTSNGLELVPDRLLVVNDSMKAALVGLGIPSEGIVVAGSPALEAQGPAERPTRAPDWLFLSQPFAVLNQSPSLGYDERVVLRRLALVAERRGVRLLVRPHPRENVSDLRGFLSSLPGRVELDANRPLVLATTSTTLVLGMTTMALVEASVQGAPTLSIQLNSIAPVRLPSIEAGKTILFTDGDLDAAVDAALAVDTSVPIERREPERSAIVVIAECVRTA